MTERVKRFPITEECSFETNGTKTVLGLGDTLELSPGNPGAPFNAKVVRKDGPPFDVSIEIADMMFHHGMIGD